MRPKILSITPIGHIRGVKRSLEEIGDLIMLDDPTTEEVLNLIKDVDAIYTNPNKSKVFLDKKVFSHANNLKVICTASTGTNHINKQDLKSFSIELLSLTEERETIDKISSTAEHALALTMTSLRNIPQSHESVMLDDWNYEDFIGRQVDKLTIGVIGYGRLGSKYSSYCTGLGATVLVYDPYKEVKDKDITQEQNIESIFKKSDVISIHVHVNDETKNLIDKKLLVLAKKNLLLINTARGEVINEEDLINFLSKNPQAKCAVDVLSNEIKSRKDNLLLNFAKKSQQVIITPHIGGMTIEAQEIAFNHAASMLLKFFKKQK